MTAAMGTPLRRAATFGALALALGVVAVRGVAQREAQAAAQLGAVAPVVVFARDVPADHTVEARDLAYRRVPVRWAPPRTLGKAEAAIGLRTAVALERGTPLTAPVLRSTEAEADDALASGDRVLELVAAGSSRLVRTGSRVDVVQTTDAADGSKRTTIVAEAVEVLDVRDAPEPADDGAAQVSATVRVPRRAALALTAAQDGGGQLRLLPRAAWDRSTLVGGG